MVKTVSFSVQPSKEYGFQIKPQNNDTVKGPH